VFSRAAEGRASVAIDKEKTLQAAQKAIEKKKYDLAIEEYRKLAAAEKNDPRWLLKIGDTQQKKGDFGGAIGSYEEVARFYASQGFHLKAVAVYNTVRDLLSKQPQHVQTQYAHVPVKLAELYEKLQLTSDALATWEQIADRLAREGRDREAIEIYKRIVGLDPSNPIAHLRLAEALSRNKDIEGAIAEFAATAEQLTAQKRVDDALKVYERLLHHRQDPKYARPAAELYLDRGGQNDGVAAIAKIQICLKSDPKSVELIALLARGFVAIGQTDKAVTIYKESARLAGEQGKKELRIDVIQRLQQLAPNDDQVRALVADMNGAPARAAQPVQPPQPAQPQQQRAIHSQPEAPRAQQPSRAQPAPVVEVEEDAELEVEEDDDDVEFEEREAAEELSDIPQQSMRSRGSRVAEVVANADAFRKVKLFAKALTTLRIGLELDPRSIAIRERIRDILIETNQVDHAIAEMVTLAAILIEEGDLQGAWDNVAWVLEAEPGHPAASATMRQLQVLTGQVPAEEPAPEPVDDELPLVPMQQSAAHDRFDELDEPEAELEPAARREEDEPLPSYSLELDEPDTSYPARAGRPAPAQDQATTEPPTTDWDEEEAVDLEPEPEPAQQTDALPAYELEEVGEEPAAEAPVSAEQALEAPSAEVEAALEEADFYASQGVYETARETIEEALRGSPQNALLLEKLRELDVIFGSKASESTTPGALTNDDRAFDIAASLGALDELEPLEAEPAAASEQIDVEEVFAKFKQGVAAQVDANASATHYDLGIAYEQMMLFDDAINEFRVAARDPSRTALCQAMIGNIHIKRGALAEATEALEIGLKSESLTREQELELLFQLGDIWGMRKSTKEAAHFYKRVIALDPRYRDAQARLAALGPQATDKGSGARSKSSLDDDFDAAFEEAMGNKR
jgi:tetratricopeptide (TPR) repeat protein